MRKVSVAICCCLLRIAVAQTDFSVTNTSLYTWNQSEWSLTTTKLIPGRYQSRLSLSNGYVGASVAAVGPFFEKDALQNGQQPLNGWPLFSPRISFSTISGFYDIQPGFDGNQTNYEWLNQYGWESFIAGIPHATAIIFDCDNKTLDATVDPLSISNFSSSFSFKTGVAAWHYTWTPANTSYDLSFTAIFSRERPNVVAVEAKIVADKDTSCKVTDLLDGSSAVRSYKAGQGLVPDSTTVWSAVHPNGLATVTAYIYSSMELDQCTDTTSRCSVRSDSDEITIGQRFNVSLKAARAAKFHKFVGVASTDKFSDANNTASLASSTAREHGWNALVSEHVYAWSRIMTEDSVDSFIDPATGQLPNGDYIEALHIASIANTFYLLQSMQPEGRGLDDDSVAVGGLTSDSYAGMVFWDADYWMAPGVNLAHPQMSKQISNFRVKQYDQALLNAQFNGYPTNASLYPWTAGRYGNCTGTGPCVDYEYHINPDICFNLAQLYNVTNNETWFNNGPKQIIYSTAMAIGEIFSFNDTTQSYWILNMTDPDEYANNKDNGAFTIASFADLLMLANTYRESDGLGINQTWYQMSHNVEFPRAASNITLEYQTMNNSVEVKQVDVGLLTYPLDYNENGYNTQQKYQDLQYYTSAQSPDGPAMTYSVFAIAANVVDTTGCAVFSYTLAGTIPYLRAPWFQFSEQAVDDYDLNGGTHPAFPFLTGHGGAHQIIPFGFLGVRTDQEHLQVDPSLPPQIPYVKVRKFYYSGATLGASINQTHTNITRRATDNAEMLEDEYTNGTMTFIHGIPGGIGNVTMYHIKINETITIANRIYSNLTSFPGNILQCHHVTSPSSSEQGRFPSSAVDGSDATKWQPTTNQSSILMVDTSFKRAVPLSGVYITWAARPALRATVYLGNNTYDDNSTLVRDTLTESRVDLGVISISNPYNATAAEAAIVVPYVGNSTRFNFTDTVWSGDYAILEIEGCWNADGSDGYGATVAEFVVY